MSTPANALSGPVWADAEGNLYLSPDGGKTWSLQTIAPGNIPAATPSSAGLMSAANGTYTYTSGLLDFTASGTGVASGIPVPSVAGLYFIGRLATVVLISGVGTATSTLPWTAGNDAGQLNCVDPSAITAASINADIANGMPIQLQLANAVGLGAILDAQTPITLKWSAVTGVTTLKGKIILTGDWITLL
jgi:hypothetical protein